MQIFKTNKRLNTISRFSAGTRTVNKTLTGSRRNENYVYWDWWLSKWIKSVVSKLDLVEERSREVEDD